MPTCDYEYWHTQPDGSYGPTRCNKPAVVAVNVGLDRPEGTVRMHACARHLPVAEADPYTQIMEDV